jgi:proteasome lid subunit RPN8/RPN11
VTPYKPVDIVIDNPDALESFRRKALRNPDREILGVLVGKVRGKVRITDIVYPTQSARETEDHFCVDYYPEEFDKIPGAIGTIHSHPSTQPILSKEDMVTQGRDGDVVFAVYSFWQKEGGKRRSTSLDFYCGSPGVVVTTSGVGS